MIWGRRWMQLMLLMLFLLLLGGATGGEAQSQQPSLPPEVREWARQLVEQLSVAIREAVFAPPAPDLDELRLRASRISNVLVGRESPDYQSKAGDPPGADGVGVLVYLERLQQAIEPWAQANEQLRPLLFALDAIRFYSLEALESLQEAMRVDDIHKARRALRRALGFLIAARGSSEDPLSEGGARALLKELSAGRP